MFVRNALRAILCALASLSLVAAAHAEEPEAPSHPALHALVEQASASVQDTLDKALDLMGIRYRRGGTSPETGFDCSGYVRHVFQEGLGLYLPHSARAMSKEGEPVAKDDLQPGDLVFFKTVRRAVSHVGIYLGDHLFIHAPRAGGVVRVEDLRENYWVKRFAGARRLNVEE
jgi:cell wall-associated NlpC family hydrolase